MLGFSAPDILQAASHVSRAAPCRFIEEHERCSTSFWGLLFCNRNLPLGPHKLGMHVEAGGKDGKFKAGPRASFRILPSIPKYFHQNFRNDESVTSKYS